MQEEEPTNHLRKTKRMKLSKKGSRRTIRNTNSINRNLKKRNKHLKMREVKSLKKEV